MSIFAEFSLPVTAFPPGGRLRAHTGVTVELEEIIPTGSVTHYLWIRDEEYEPVVDDLRTEPSVESIEILDELDDRALVRIHWKGVEMPILELIEECGGWIAGATGTADGWSITLRFPQKEALSTFYERCRERGIALELLGINETGFRESDAAFGLTGAQREAVLTAVEEGYFDIPRQVTISELAEQLGISDQAVSERLRRGLEKFLTATLHESEATDPDDTGVE
jgi:predicted DNA binding protein